MISEAMLGIREGSRRNFPYSSGNRFKASTPPEIELRVVSLPPTTSSRILPRNSIGGMSRVASPWARHRQQVVRRRLVYALVAQFGKTVQALPHRPPAMFIALGDTAAGNRRGHVRPVSELVSVLEREIEQRREHARGEIDRNALDPVEFLP